MKCIICYANPILITNAKTQARKHLILYNDANAIIALKKHVYANHCMIAKIFEKVNNLLKKPYERQLTKKRPHVNGTIIFTSVDNPWLRHSSHPQEKEGGPKKKRKKKKNPPLPPTPALPPLSPPSENSPRDFRLLVFTNDVAHQSSGPGFPFSESDCPGRFPFSESDRPGRFRRSIKTRNCPVGRTHGRTHARTHML
jgi:hypothetical protein